MDVIARDVCEAHGYRLTEFQLINGNEIIDTFFCIRDEQGNKGNKDENKILNSIVSAFWCRVCGR